MIHVPASVTERQVPSAGCTRELPAYTFTAERAAMATAAATAEQQH